MSRTENRADLRTRDDGVAEAWSREIERRVHVLETGEVELVSQEDAQARIEARLSARRRATR